MPEPATADSQSTGASEASLATGRPPEVPSSIDTRESLEQLRELIDDANGEACALFLHALDASEVAYVISHLGQERHTTLFRLLAQVRPELAADLMEHFTDEHAADLIDELEPHHAAAIVSELPSDDRTDVLAELEEHEAEAILGALDPLEAASERRRLGYDPETAGGLMITETLSYARQTLVGRAVEDIRSRVNDGIEYEARYIFVVDEEEKLIGLISMRSLMLTPGSRTVGSVAREQYTAVTPDTDLDELTDLFEKNRFEALPVVDADHHLLGVVQRIAVTEAMSERAEESLLKVGGIVGGEETRVMSFRVRLLGRLAFLVPIMYLLIISASVIALFEGTVAEVPIIAAFLPVVAGLCGSFGTQAVAVSMREVALGLIRPADAWRVLGNELSVALVNGLLLGLLLGVTVWVLEGQPRLGIVVGASVPLAACVSVSVGGTSPLLLQHWKIDPAMVAGPLVNTVVDLTSFMSVLALTAWLLL